jgi:hypothetical protein
MTQTMEYRHNNALQKHHGEFQDAQCNRGKKEWVFCNAESLKFGHEKGNFNASGPLSAFSTAGKLNANKEMEGATGESERPE